MARDVLKVNLELDRLQCHDEGDGWGSAEPYLWTVFFKIDGSTATVTDSLTLSGNALTQTHGGSQGNLPNDDVDAGESITIPASMGHFETELKPIKGGILDAFDADLGGVVGVVAVLMEEDNVPNSAAEAGHVALNNAVQTALDQIVATRSFENQDVTDAEIAQFENDIKVAVENAIKGSLNFFESIWAWVNPDDTIGSHVFLFKHDDLADGGTINFTRRWANEGDWELFGHVTSSVLCPAGALDNVFGATSAMKSMDAGGRLKVLERAEAPARRGDPKHGRAFDLQALRAFRDGAYRQQPGLAAWWALADRNTVALVHAVLANRELREPVRRLMDALPAVVAKPDAAVPPAFFDDLERVAKGLLRGGTRRLRLDAAAVASIVGEVRGKSFKEVSRTLAATPPSRPERRIRPTPIPIDRVVRPQPT